MQSTEIKNARRQNTAENVQKIEQRSKSSVAVLTHTERAV